MQHELAPIIRSVRTLRDVFSDVWVRHHLDDPTVRFLFTTIDLTATVLGGIVEDDLVGRGFQAVNGEELRAWIGQRYWRGNLELKALTGLPLEDYGYALEAPAEEIAKPAASKLFSWMGN